MADTKRTVQIDISVIGNFEQRLKNLEKSFGDLSKVTDNFRRESNLVATALSNIRFSPEFQKGVEQLLSLSKQSLPNVKQLAEGFKLLESVKIVDLSPFAKEIEKFKDLKVPALKQLAQGFQILGESTELIAPATARLRILYRALRRFDGLSLPNLLNIAKSIVILIKDTTNVELAAKKLDALIETLQRLGQIKLPSLSGIANGIIKITDKSTDLTNFSSRIDAVVIELKKFEGIKLPNLNNIANGVTKLTEKGLDLTTFSNRIATVVTELAKFEKIKLPNLNNIAQGVIRLTDKTTDIDKFSRRIERVITELKKFDGIKLPNLNNIASGIIRLTDKDTNLATFSDRINKVREELIKFDKIKLPGLSNISNGVVKLTLATTDLNQFSDRIDKVVEALKRFDKIKLPGLLGIARAVEKLSDSGVNMTLFSSRIRRLVTDLTRFEGIKLPNLNNISKAVTSLTDKDTDLDKFSRRIDKVITELRKFEGIKLPNLLQISTGITKLIGDTVQMGLFQDRIRKVKLELIEFSKVRVPNLLNIANAVVKLSGTEVQMGLFAQRIRRVISELRDFKEVRVPNLLNIANALLTLSNSTSIMASATTNLRGVLDVIKEYTKLKIPNLNQLAVGFKKFQEIKLGDTPIKLAQLARVLTVFNYIKLPALNSMALGFERIAKLNIGVVIGKIRVLANTLKILEENGQLDTFKKLASDLRVLGNVLGKTQVNLSQLRAQMSQAQSVTSSFSEKIQEFGQRIQRYMSYRLIADAVFTLKQGFTEGAKAVVDYDQALRDLQAITSASSLEVEQMGSKIRQVASDTKFSATEVAEGMRTFGQAGFTAAESIKAIEATSNLATGTLENMSNTVDLMSTAMRVFQLDASESARVADVFANAVNGSKLTIDKLRIAFNYVGPVASTAGLTFEETAASLMQLANAGLRASTMGTGLRRILSEMVSPSEGMRKAMDAVGMTIDDFDPKIQGMTGVIDNLRVVISDTSVAFEAFGKRGAAAALALVDANNIFDTMLEAASKSGTAAQMAETQLLGLGTQIKNFYDKAQLFAISFSESSGLTAAFKVFIKFARQMIDVLTFLIESPFAKLILKTTLVTAALLGLVGAIKVSQLVFISMRARLAELVVANTYLQTAFATTTGSLVTLRTVMMSLITNPIVLALTAAAVAFTVLASSIKSSYEASNEASKAFDELTSKVQVVDKFKERITGLTEGTIKYKQETLRLREELGKVAEEENALSEAARRAMLSIDAFNGTIDDGSEAINAYYDAIRELERIELAKSIKGAEDNVKSLSNNFNKLKYIVYDFGDSAKRALLSTFELLGSIINLDFSQMLPSLGNALLSVSEMLQSAFKLSPFPWLSKGLKSFTTLLQDYLIPAFTKFLSSFSTVSDFAVKLVQRITGITLATKLLSKENAELIPDYQKLKVAAQEAIDASNKATKAQRDQLEAFRQTSTEVFDTIEYLKRVGQLNVEFMSAEEVVNNAKALGLIQDTGSIVAQGLIVEFTALQQAFNNRIDNMVDKWEKESKKFNLENFASPEGLAEVLKSGPTDLEEWGLLINKVSTETVKAYQDQRDAITSAYKSNEEWFAASAKSEEERIYYLRKRTELAQRAGKIEAEFTKSSTKAIIDSIVSINAAYDAQIAKIEENYKGTDHYAELKAKAVIERENRIQEALLKSANLSEEALEQLAADTERLSDVIKARNDEMNSIIDLDEARGTVTLQQAQKARMNLTEEYYADLLEMHRDHVQALLAAGRTEGDQEYDDAVREVIQLEQEQRIKRRELLVAQYDDLKEYKENYTDTQEEITKELKENNDAVEDIEKKHTDKITSLRRDKSTKVRNLERTLNATLKKLAKERLENERSVERDIIDIYANAADKINSIRQRSMTDEEKDADDRRNMYKKLAEGEEAVRDARRTGNREELERGKQLLSQASDMASSLNDEKAALHGVRAAAEELAKAREVEGGFDEKAIKAQEQAAKNEEKMKKQAVLDEFELKIQKQQEAHKELMTTEAERHETEMSNLEKELAKYREKVESIQEIINLLENQQKGGEQNVANELDDLRAIAELGIKTELVIEGEDAADRIKKKLDDLDGMVTRSKHIVEYEERKSKGGPVGLQFFNKGGIANTFKSLTNRFISAGQGLKDDVPAMLKRGEYVQRAEAVRDYGMNFMSMINNRLIPPNLIKNLVRHFSLGGPVDLPTSNLSSLVPTASAAVRNTQTTRMSFVFDDIAYETQPVQVAQNDYNVIVQQFKKHARFSS